MNKGNATIISVIALALVVALGVAYFGSTVPKGEKGDKGDSGLTVTGPQGPKGEKGDSEALDLSVLRNLQNALQNLSNVVGKLPKAPLGAIPGPDFYGPFWGVNDVRSFYSRLSLGSSWAGTEGTTTPCRIASPLNATSTLLADQTLIHINEQATGTYIQLGKTQSAAEAGNIFATTTLIGDKYDLPANVSVDLIASTTAAQTNSVLVFGPNEFLVMRISGGTAGTQRLTGSCETEFRTF